MYALEEKCERRKCSKQGGSVGMLHQKTFNFTVSGMLFPAFSEGHFQEINAKENAVGGSGGGKNFFSFFTPL